jgi:hypothetical protein
VIERQFTEARDHLVAAAEAEGEDPVGNRALCIGDTIGDAEDRALHVLEHPLENLAEGRSPPAIVERVAEPDILVHKSDQGIERMGRQRLERCQVGIGWMGAHRPVTLRMRG